MRDPYVKNKVHTHRKRQVIAAAIAMAAGTAFTVGSVQASDPTQAGARLPLPLSAASQPSSTGNSLQVNPFCLPDEPAVRRDIQLASGSESSSTIRLKPIGVAIGLQTPTDGEPRRVNAPAMTIETPEPTPVQTNPMAVESNALASQPVLDSTVAQVTGEVEASEQGSRTFESQDRQINSPKASSIILLPMKRTFLNADEIASDERQIVAEAVPQARPSHPEPMVIPQAPEYTPVEMMDEVVQDDSELVQATDVDDEPVMFSFSDGGVENLDETESISEDFADDDVADLVVKTESTARPSNDLAGSAGVEPLSLDSIEDARPIGDDAAPRRNQYVKSHDEASIAKLTRSSEKSLQSRRYRPPVAVQPMTIAIEDVVASPEFQVRSAEDTGVELSKTHAEKLVENTTVIPLYLNRAEVRSLTLGAQLRSVEVADKNVCQAFAAGPNQLRLIGTGNGVTRLVVWAEPIEGRSTPRVKTFDIHVKDEVETGGVQAGNQIEMLNQSIANAFPDADVLVRQGQQELIVIGRCGSEATAKKILRMVRKACLAPVDDQLKVR
ncbi:pilus assembly protein N-terminal domain-containing protein [Rubripirellula amarantea]|nr:pilus assembly protein N-terminal domain-containing protein [Rubripirellula amarantea]